MKELWRRLPEWAQGILTYIAGVIVICGVPVSPALIALLVVTLVRG